jgi:hypothetical protein
MQEKILDYRKISFGDRLDAAIKMINKNASKFSEKHGLSKSSLYAIIKNSQKPSSDILEKLWIAGININWLLTGEGEPLLAQSAIKEEAGRKEMTSGELVKEHIQLKQRIGRLIMLRKIQDDGRIVTVEREQFVDVLIESLDALSTVELRRLFDALRPLLNDREKKEQERPAV